MHVEIYLILVLCLLIGINSNKRKCGSIDYTYVHKINKNVNSKVNGRILGGQDVQIFYPWFIGFTKLPLRILRPVIRNRIHCGGTLITEKHILTAAHCFEDEIYSAKMFVAISNLKNMCKFDNLKDVHRIYRIILHSKFNSYLLINDIAIVQLKNDINQMPICLPNLNMSIPARMEVIGYGVINKLKELPCRLQGVVITVYEMKKCRPVNGGTIEALGPKIEDTMICAGEIDGYLDACQGDSGGPLQAKTSDNFILFGIVSYGRGCGIPNYLGIYTNVSHYINWIEKYTSS